MARFLLSCIVISVAASIAAGFQPSTPALPLSMPAFRTCVITGLSPTAQDCRLLKKAAESKYRCARKTAEVDFKNAVNLVVEGGMQKRVFVQSRIHRLVSRSQPTRDEQQAALK
eukprot:CAMPEP_0172584928 /NCGR_PEP_ID=MMETSP1068-20121228/4458_1 /TAXON_ID=35684 /ORGANISM="Pseudopedinella elastica, Strain CCMP716" /LENGTH=113 /DNA_ID=CAMNT_0013379245 /DNA_START=72 /DNA_END=413 /DNA_ORIENTATION=+